MSLTPRTLAFAAELPGWMEALRHRAGPLLAPAAELQRWKGPDPFPDGREGIRRLGHLVDALAFDESASDEDDARFVECAGSMLGLLLVAHVGLGRHRERGGVHRIELGEHGFFDPFGAIDAALGADRPSAELARRIAAAEAEAAGEGPVARTLRALLAALARGAGARSVRERFGPHVVLDDGIELDLERFVELAGTPGADLDGALDRLVAMLTAGTSALRWDEARHRLLPRLTSERFVAELQRERDVSIHFRPLSHGLGVALVLAYDGRLRFLRASEASSFRDATLDFEGHALSALADRAEATRWRATPLAERPCAVATRADGLAASLLLVPGVRAELAARLGSPFVVAVPHRDVLIATHDEAPFEALALHVAEEHRRAPHGLSPSLYRVLEGADLRLRELR